MRALSNTRNELDQFQNSIFSRIDQIYDLNAYTTAAQLKAFIEDENRQLQHLQQDAYHDCRKAAYKGLGADGVAYPMELWAECLGAKYKRPVFSSIRRQVPLAEDIAKASVRPSSQGTGSVHSGAAAQDDTLGKVIGSVAAGVGVAGIVTSLVITPVSGWLLALGIVATAGGVVKMVRVKQEAGRTYIRMPEIKQPDPGVSAAADRDKVQAILKEQRADNKAIIRKWVDGLYAMIEQAVAAKESEAQQ